MAKKVENQEVQKDIDNASKQMDEAITSLSRNYNTLRTGRANPNMLERINVDYYGVRTPIQQVATVTAPDATTIVITPFDPSTIKQIERAILISDLGFNPTNDGHLIRIVVPTPTEERRKELVRQAKKTLEDCKVEIRNIRRKAVTNFKKLEKDKEITEDDLKDGEKLIQDVTNDKIKEADKVFKQKEEEILAV